MTTYMAWKKSDSTAIYWTYFHDGQWETQNRAAERAADFTTSVGPGLTILSDSLLMAWNTPGSGAIHWATYNGSWSGQQPARDFATTGQPGLWGASMVWKGGTDQSIFTSTLANGRQWSDRVQAEGMGTSVGPTVTKFRGKPYMAWKGTIGRNNDQSIYWSTFDAVWAPQQQVPNVGSNIGPALAETPQGLLMAWKGAWDDNRIWWTVYDGQRWADQQIVPGARTSVGPALASTPTGALMTWKAETDNSIWWTTFDNSRWADQRQVPGVDTSYRPALTTRD